METYNEKLNKKLVGKTIVEADVNGDGIELYFIDGSHFTYCASDGGYSSYELYEKGEN